MTGHRDQQDDLGPSENGRRAAALTPSGSTVGAGTAWSRAAAVAGASLLVSILVLTIIVGPLSAQGAGRVTGRFLFVYVIAAVIATLRPRYRPWRRIVALFFSVFCGVHLLLAVGPLVDVLESS